MNKIIFWSSFFALTCVLIYFASDSLAPFVISLIFAYILQPVVSVCCEKFKLSRNIVTFGVFSLFFTSFIAIFVLIVPMIYRQFTVFITKLPQYKVSFESGMAVLSAKLEAINPDLANKVAEFSNSFINGLFGVFASFSNYIWQYTLATINFFTILILVPIILYYFLRDWNIMTTSVESLIPMQEMSKTRKILTSINSLLSAYIRGQLNICLIGSCYYVIGLHLIGLDFALLLGIISGFFIIIPFVGAVISFLLAAISCYFSFGTGIELWYVSILFVVGHILEGYILSPKIIGDKIGLHPVWIIFAVLIGANLFGILGVMFAIPIAGVIRLLLINMVDYYKSSKIYKNPSKPAKAPIMK